MISGLVTYFVINIRPGLIRKAIQAGQFERLFCFRGSLLDYKANDPIYLPTGPNGELQEHCILQRTIDMGVSRLESAREVVLEGQVPVSLAIQRIFLVGPGKALLDA